MAPLPRASRPMAARASARALGQEAFAAFLLQEPAIALTLMCALHPRSAAPSSRA